MKQSRQAAASIINTTLSLMVVDPTGMPPNLGHSQREDYPESLFRVVAYDAKNVLPTALGYRSHFSENTLFDVANCPSSHVQQVLVYQGADYAVSFILLAEEGAWIANATNGQATGWISIFFSGNDPANLIRHQWSYAVVANQLYIYQQGQVAYYGICTPDYYDNNLIQTTIPKATITGILRNGGYGILKVIPSFINMAGQVGIFRADTRLGFWDSANSVSWSSATQTYDFTPSVTSFAGNTMFADVVGKISKVLGQGDGFVIYSARSVVQAVGTTSQEMWSGHALLSDTGVAFDAQVCAAQPDDTHYALTGSGLYEISGSTAKPIQVEVSDYLMENSLVYAVDVIDARYLFLHADKDLIPSHYDIEVRAPDMDGNLYEFKPTIPEDQFTDAAAMTQAVLQGQQASIQADFTYSAEPTTTPPIVNTPGYATIPCYTGDGLDTNFNRDVLPSGSSESHHDYTIDIPSSVDSSQSYTVKVLLNKPNFSSYYYDVDQHFIDKAAQDFQTQLKDTLDKLTLARQVVSDGVALFTGGVEYQRLEGEDQFIAAVPQPIGAIVTSTIDEEETLTWTWHDIIEGTQGNAKKSSCGYGLDGKLEDIKFTVNLTVNERVDPYYNIVETHMGNDVYLAYSLGLIHTPKIQTAKFMFINRGDIGIAPYGIVGCNQDAADVLTAMFQGTYEVGDIVMPGTQYKAYPGMVGHGGLNGEFQNDNISPGDVWGVGVHAALGGSLDFAYSSNSTDYPPVNPVCGETSSETDFNYDLIPSLIGTLYEGRAAGTSTILTGALTEDGICIPDSQALNVSNRIILVSGWPGYNTAYIYGSVFLDPNDADVVNTFNLLKKVIRLDSITADIVPTYTPQPDVIPVFDAIISGFGYQPSGGFSFRKTHNRSNGSPCIPSGPVSIPFDPSDSTDSPATIPIDSYIPKAPAPTKYTYPQPIPRPPISSLFQVGTPAPFYPVYHSAIIFDINLQKWGRYNNEHQVIYGTLPTNRVDHTVVPVVDKGIRGGAFNSTNLTLSFFTPQTNNAMISYGKIGRNRQGVTEASKVIAAFANPANCNIIIETSRDGITVDTASTIYIPVVNQLLVEFPFTETGKWFNIRFEGQFDLTYLEMESAATGRR